MLTSTQGLTHSDTIFFTQDLVFIGTQSPENKKLSTAANFAKVITRVVFNSQIDEKTKTNVGVPPHD